MSNNIDAVILYVDMNDSVWRRKFNKYVEENEIPNKYINNERRFRDYGSLLSVLRSIDMYAPWINNVFLVVQSDSQVPDWVNRDTVKVVLHEEFIPRDFLPTFNCNTIETHLHFIPELGEKFIYFNDDTLLNKINNKEDYFIGDKCVYYMTKRMSNDKLKSIDQLFYRKMRFSNIKALHKNFKEINLDYIYYNSHGPTPMIKSICGEIYEKIDIKNHISVFREYKNLTQELFTIYMLYKRKLILMENSVNTNDRPNLTTIKNKYISEYLPKNHEKTIINFFSGHKKTFCMNDVFYNSETDIDLCKEIKRILNIRFFKKCKYEK